MATNGVALKLFRGLRVFAQLSFNAVLCCFYGSIIYTILETTDLQVDRLNRRLIPNPAHPNQPVLPVR